MLNLKNLFSVIIDNIIWLLFFSSISLLFLYISFPVISYYVTIYKIKNLNSDYNIIGQKIKQIKKNLEKQLETYDNGKEINLNEKVLKIKEIIKKIKKGRTKNNIEINLTKNKTNKFNKLVLIPLKDFILNSNKILVNGYNSKLIYRSIEKNIQKDLWDKSVISLFYDTPIIFTHSSGGKYNFGLFFLFLKKNSIIYLSGTYNNTQYFIELKIVDIYRNIPGNKLYDYLKKIHNKWNFKNNFAIFLDTCELQWRKRRVLVAVVNDFIFK